MTLIANISPPKCGTTALFHCLTRCEDTKKPRIKEPRFFAPPKGEDVGDVPDFLLLNGCYDFGISWFHDLFDDPKNPPNAKYLIDFTTYYSTIPQSPELMHKHFPDAKLLFIMRDPVDRFVSHYYEFAKAGVSVEPISDIIHGDSDVSRWMFAFADYRDTYDRYAALFGADNICVLTFETLKNDSAALESDVREFLDLPDFTFAPTDTEKNVSGRAKSNFVQYLLRGPITKTLSRFVPPMARSRLLTLRKKLVLMNTKQVKNPPLSDEDRTALQKRLAKQYDFYNSYL